MRSGRGWIGEVGDGEHDSHLVHAADAMSVHPVNPLVRCPRCRSRLIASEHSEVCPDGVLVDRRCPECDYRDRVFATAFAAAVWERHDARVAASLHALADALAAGAPLVVSDIAARAGR